MHDRAIDQTEQIKFEALCWKNGLQKDVTDDNKEVRNFSNLLNFVQIWKYSLLYYVTCLCKTIVLRLHTHLKDSAHAREENYIYIRESVRIIYFSAYRSITTLSHKIAMGHINISKVLNAFPQDIAVFQASCLFLRRSPWFYSTDSVFHFAENSCQMAKMHSIILVLWASCKSIEDNEVFFVVVCFFLFCFCFFTDSKGFRLHWMTDLDDCHPFYTWRCLSL